MQQRRSFLGAIAGFFAGLLTSEAKASAWPEDRVRVFRFDIATGNWNEIVPQQVRKGDWLIWIGVSENDKNLWRLLSMQADDDWRPCPDGTPNGQNTARSGTRDEMLQRITELASGGEWSRKYS